MIFILSNTWIDTENESQMWGMQQLNAMCCLRVQWEQSAQREEMPGNSHWLLSAVTDFSQPNWGQGRFFFFIVLTGYAHKYTSKHSFLKQRYPETRRWNYVDQPYHCCKIKIQQIKNWMGWRDSSAVKVLVALPENRVQFQTLRLCSSQHPVTEAPRDWHFLLCGHSHKYIHVNTYTHVHEHIHTQ